MASASERKLNNLTTAKTKLNLNANRKGELVSKVIEVRDSLEEYIRNDNLDSFDATDNLLTEIENHSDLSSAVSYLNRAISNTKAQIAAEEAAARKAAEEAAAAKAAKSASSNKATSSGTKTVKSTKR